MDAMFAHLSPTAREVLVDVGIVLAVLAGWFVLQKWVLPRFGVST